MKFLWGLQKLDHVSGRFLYHEIHSYIPGLTSEPHSTIECSNTSNISKLKKAQEEAAARIKTQEAHAKIERTEIPQLDWPVESKDEDIASISESGLIQFKTKEHAKNKGLKDIIPNDDDYKYLVITRSVENNVVTDVIKRGDDGNYYTINGGRVGIDTGDIITPSCIEDFHPAEIRPGMHEKMSNIIQSNISMRDSVSGDLIEKGSMDYSPETAKFEKKDKTDLNDMILDLKDLPTREAKIKELRYIIQMIKYSGNITLHKFELPEQCSIRNSDNEKICTADIADSLVMEYFEAWYEDPETKAIIKNLLFEGESNVFIPKFLTGEETTFSFNSLGLKVLESKITLEQLLVDREPPVNFVYVNGHPAALLNVKDKVTGENKKKFYYITEDGGIGDPVKIGNGTKIQITSKEKDPVFRYIKTVKSLTNKDAISQFKQNQTVLGRIYTRYETSSREQKSLMSDSTKDFYKTSIKEYQETQRHSSLNNYNHEQHDHYQEGDAAAADTFGMVSEEPIQEGEYSGLYSYRLNDYPQATTYLKKVPGAPDKIIIQNKGEGGDVEFSMDGQSKESILFFTILSHAGNADAIDRTQGLKESLSSTQLENKMNDLLHEHGSIFRSGEVEEIANTLFYLQGDSFLSMLSRLSVQNGENKEDLVNNKENASGISRMEFNPNAMAHNRLAILRFLKRMGSKAINPEDLQNHMKENNRRILVDQEGRLIAQQEPALQQ